LVASKYVMGTGMIIVAVVAFAVGLVAGPIILPPSAAADPVWDNIVKTGIIQAGTEPGWPPYEYLNTTNSQIIGFEIDLTNAIAERLNLTVEWHNMGFSTIIPSIQSKELDLGVSGFSVTADRLEEVEFTMPHSITHGQVIMLQSKATSLGITTITSLADLKTLGLTVGTQKGTTELDELLAASVAYKAFDDYGAAINDMAGLQGVTPTVDCVYAETPVTPYYIAYLQTQTKPTVVIYDTPYYPCAFVANKNAHTLVAKINGALSDIIATGQLDALRAKWNA